MKLSQYFVLILAIASCHSNQANNSYDFRRIIPGTTTIYGNALQGWRVEYCQKFELPLIDAGVDSFEFRFWVSQYSLKPSYIIVVNHDSSGWHKKYAHLYSGLVEDSSQHAVTDQLTIDSNTGKWSAVQLYYLVKGFYVESLPDQQELPGFIDTSASKIYYTIELASRRYYKLIRYHSPESYLFEKNNKKIAELAEIF